MKRINPKILGIFLGGMLSIHLGMAWNLRDLLRRGYPDFATFYTAGTMVRTGHGYQLYDVQAQFRVQQEFAPSVTIRKAALQYLHPPFEAVAFAPLTWLSYFHAYLLWVLINLLILFALPLPLRPYIALLRARPWMVALAGLACFPIFFGCLQGQDTIPLLALVTLVYVSLKRNADFTAGVWLGMGLFRFQFALPLFFVLLALKKRKMVLGFVLVAFLFGVISLAACGWRETLAYPSYLRQVEKVLGHGSIIPTDMTNLHGFLYELARQRIPNNVFTAMVVLGSVLLLGFAFLRWRPASSGWDFDLSFSIAIVAAVLVSYHGFLYDLGLLFLPLVLLADHFDAIELTDIWTRTALIVPAAMLLLSPLQILLWLHYHQASLLVPFLLFWMWGMARLKAEIAGKVTGRGLFGRGKPA